MSSGVLIGAACGAGTGVVVAILCYLIFVYLKKRNERKGRKRKQGFAPSGSNIFRPHSPSAFRIPPIVPLHIQPTVQEFNFEYQLSPPSVSPALSEGSRSPTGGSRRSSVHLNDILTLSTIDDQPKRKLSPTCVRAANEPAIANLYITQKRRMGLKRQSMKKVNESILGELEFTLFYEQSVQELQIYIMRALQVYIPWSDGRVNLAVKAIILLDGEPVWQDKTGTTEACGEADFSEKLIAVDLSDEKLRKSWLRLIVLDDDISQAVGEVVYPLSNLPFNQFTTETLQLDETEDVDFGEENQDNGNYLGKLLISMVHNRDEKMLTIGVECAEGLPAMIKGTEVCSFVKVVVMHSGKKLHSSSTKVVNKTRNPDYNEIFDFMIPDDKLPQVTIYFKVKHVKMMRDVSIGMVKLGTRNRHNADHETEYRHFEQVLDMPHLCINNWHVIRKHR